MFSHNPTKIVITGANGLIGRLVAQHLKGKGFELFGIDCIAQDELSRRFQMEKHKRGDDSILGKPFPGKYYIADITNPVELENAINKIGKVHLVIHLAAALEGNSPDTIHKVNVEGTRNIFEMCGKHNIHRVIFGSSIVVVWDIYCREEPYSSIQQGNYLGDPIGIPKVPATIRSTLIKGIIENPSFTAYANSKIQGELIALHYASKHNITMVLARFGTVTTRDEKVLEPRRASVLCGWKTACEFIEAQVNRLLNDPQAIGTFEPHFVVSQDIKYQWVQRGNETTTKPAIRSKL